MSIYERENNFNFLVSRPALKCLGFLLWCNAIVFKMKLIKVAIDIFRMKYKKTLLSSEFHPLKFISSVCKSKYIWGKNEKCVVLCFSSHIQQVKGYYCCVSLLPANLTSLFFVRGIMLLTLDLFALCIFFLLVRRIILKFEKTFRFFFFFS